MLWGTFVFFRASLVCPQHKIALSSLLPRTCPNRIKCYIRRNFTYVYRSLGNKWAEYAIDVPRLRVAVLLMAVAFYHSRKLFTADATGCAHNVSSKLVSDSILKPTLLHTRMYLYKSIVLQQRSTSVTFKITTSHLSRRSLSKKQRS